MDAKTLPAEAAKLSPSPGRLRILGGEVDPITPRQMLEFVQTRLAQGGSWS